MADILETIVARKRRDLEQMKSRVPAGDLERRLATAPEVLDFAGAVAEPGQIKLIAEVKRASPSAGVLRDPFDAVEIACTYEAHGAAAISVLTDEPFFQGRLEHLSAIRAAVRLPLLRKDFLLDPYQVLEARVAGADAVLLIAEVLGDGELRTLLGETRALGMEALVESYEEDNLPRVLDSGATIIGINNRNLRHFRTDLEHTLRLRDRVPPDRVLVSESGIRTRADVRRLEEVGVNAILVGETLLRSPDIGDAIRALLGHDE
ncbi:MAG: indole-3-glycerol phosphate synthase TrpC [Planctomycetes bacterium]|nr:indole-3-glycerol phosphate synthase TrpC [Planctomycetota bacterium]